VSNLWQDSNRRLSLNKFLGNLLLFNLAIIIKSILLFPASQLGKNDTIIWQAQHCLYQNPGMGVHRATLQD